MLPIAEPCSVFRPSAGRTFCQKCEKHVHDLSEMTERQAQRFLEANAGRSICVAYRSRKDGTIVVRPEPRTLGVVLVALGLAACTGYAPDVQHPDETCRDAQGYEIDCHGRARTDVVVPEAQPETGLVEIERPPVTPELADVPIVPIAAPELEPELTAGTMVYVPEMESAPAKRESRRAARRERRAARNG